MKRIVFCIAVLVLANVDLMAQDRGELEFGGNAGLNIASVSTISGNNSADSRIAFNIGASAEYYFSDRWGIKGKLIYDSKGWGNGFVEDENLNIITADFRLNYLSVPLMANWHFGARRNWYLNFGPYVGLLLNAKDSELGLEVTDGLKSSDAGLAFGIGCKFEINRDTQLFVELDGQSGFTDIFEENSGDAIRNTRSSLNFGVLFNL